MQLLVSMYMEASRLIEACRFQLARSEGEGVAIITVHRVSKELRDQLLATYQPENRTPVVTTGTNQVVRRQVPRWLIIYNIPQNDYAIKIRNVKPLQTLKDLFSDDMLWAPRYYMSGDMLADNGIDYAVCLEPTDNVVNGEATGYGIDICRISGDVKFRFRIEHRRMQRSQDRDGDSVDPFNRPMFAFSLLGVMEVGDIVIPLYIMIDGLRFERLQLETRVEYLSNYHWRLQSIFTATK